MQFADEPEKADDFKSALPDIVKRTMIEHDRIIFNGNNYSDNGSGSSGAGFLI